MELGENAELNMDTALNLFSTICYNNKNFIQAGFIVSNGRELASIQSGGAVVKFDNYTHAGSGGIYVDGLLKNGWKKGMGMLEARDLAVKAISLAIEADGGRGGNCRIVDVKESGESRMEIVDNSVVKENGRMT